METLERITEKNINKLGRVLRIYCEGVLKTEKNGSLGKQLNSYNKSLLLSYQNIIANMFALSLEKLIQSSDDHHKASCCENKTAQR